MKNTQELTPEMSEQRFDCWQHEHIKYMSRILKLNAVVAVTYIDICICSGGGVGGGAGGAGGAGVAGAGAGGGGAGGGGGGGGGDGGGGGGGFKYTHTYIHVYIYIYVKNIYIFRCVTTLSLSSLTRQHKPNIITRRLDGTCRPTHDPKPWQRFL